MSDAVMLDESVQYLGIGSGGGTGTSTIRYLLVGNVPELEVAQMPELKVEFEQLVIEPEVEILELEPELEIPVIEPEVEPLELE